MANDCLVKRLKGVVNNPELEELGVLKVNTVGTDPLFVGNLSACKIKVKTGTFDVSTCDSNGQNVTLVATGVAEYNLDAGAFCIVQPSNSNATVYISNKYTLSGLGRENSRAVINLDDIKYCNSITTMYLGKGSYGDVSNYYDGNTHGVEINFVPVSGENNNNIVGTLNNNFNSTVVGIQRTSVSGNIGTYTPNIYCLEIGVYNNGLYGDIKQCADNLVAAGKTSGIILFRAAAQTGDSTQCMYDGKTIHQANLDAGIDSWNLKLQFSAGGYTIIQ